MLASKRTEWRDAQRCYFHTDPLRKKDISALMVGLLSGALQQIFFFLKERWKSSRRNCDWDPDCKSEGGKKNQKVDMKEELSNSSFHCKRLPNSFHLEASMPKVRPHGQVRERKTARLRRILVRRAFTPRCPSASGVYLPAHKWVAGAFQEHESSHRTKGL